MMATRLLNGRPTSRVAAIALLLAASVPALADIPRPDRDRDSGGLAERIELGPIEPLPAVAEPISRDGAGRLPRGVIVETEVAAIDPVQRETILVTQTILDPARQLRGVEVHRPAGKGIDTQVLEASQDTVEIDGRRVNRRHYRWAVQALRPGEVTLEFQRIEFDVVGRAQSEYAWLPVARRLEVTRLPAHWPEYLPVTPALTFGEEQVSDLVAGEPGEWRFNLVGEGLSAKAIEQLLRAQLTAPPGLRIDEPSIRLAPEQAPAEAMGPLAEAWEVRLSLLPAVEGGGDGTREARLPALTLPFVDPRRLEASANLAEVALDYARRDARTVAWQAEPAERRWATIRAALPWVIGGALALLVIVTLGRFGWRRWRAHHAWRQAQRDLRAAPDARALRDRLNHQLAGLPRPMPSPSRGELATRGAPDDWLAARAGLDRLCFAGVAGEDEAFRRVRATLAGALPARWFR
ncbi:hypothetical protein LV475_03010 [Guyparkeria hydrothermalis]|uniref:hypothetical protein n=1 Tax=Guyparkeria hydrothermalis TaxID=923 RepID=UPI00202190E1|nr:hypothetical protein [Guyparkeria hydrothermalis]MCL7750573.1 hypothetical protein [Guyparkeria hydrothermalis]